MWRYFISPGHFTGNFEHIYNFTFIVLFLSKLFRLIMNLPLQRSSTAQFPSNLMLIWAWSGTQSWLSTNLARHINQKMMQRKQPGKSAMKQCSACLIPGLLSIVRSDCILSTSLVLVTCLNKFWSSQVNQNFPLHSFETHLQYCRLYTIGHQRSVRYAVNRFPQYISLLKVGNGQQIGHCGQIVKNNIYDNA